MAEFLHERRDFARLIAIVAERRGIDPVARCFRLVRKRALDLFVRCLEVISDDRLNDVGVNVIQEQFFNDPDLSCMRAGGHPKSVADSKAKLSKC